MEGKGGFTLLGRRENGFLEVLTFSLKDGKEFCLFDTQELAGALLRSAEPGLAGTWDDYGHLPHLVEQFDYVTLNPGSSSELEEGVDRGAGIRAIPGRDGMLDDGR